MPLLQRSKVGQVLDALMEAMRRLEESLRSLQADVDSRLDAITEALDSEAADREVEATAAERIRNGAAARTSDGAAVLDELGIHHD